MPSPFVVPEDDGLLVLDDQGIVAASKPSGEVVIAARGEPPGGVSPAAPRRQLGRRLWVVHRIDRDASGVVLFATTRTVHRTLSIAFEERRVRKTYRAFTTGELAPPHGRLEVSLHPARKGKMRPDLARRGGSGGGDRVRDAADLGSRGRSRCRSSRCTR